MKEKFMEVIRFGINGGLSFIVDYGVMILLKECLGVHYLLASSISFVLSVIVNYYICVLWVFKGVNKQKTNMTLFIGSSVIGLGLNSLFMYLLVEFLFINYMISKIFATVIVMIWNYIMKKKSMNIS